jgi:mannose-6-phosphate isomerase-like protein (cupin superfamily)
MQALPHRRWCRRHEQSPWGETIVLNQIRRVVTGFNKDGRSTFIFDGPTPIVGQDPSWPTRGTTLVWGTEVPASNEGNVLAEQVAPPSILPQLNGVSFIIMQIAPESELESMTAEQRRLASAPVGGTFPGSYQLDISQGPHMHATDTVDLCIVLCGEVTFYVDDGEVTLKPFDTIIDRGANHGWINRGKVPCLVASAVIDAKQLNREVYRK